MLHELVRTWTRLVGVLPHGLVSRVSSGHRTAHSTHSLILLDRCAMHRCTALSMMELWRCMHGRLLRERRLLRSLRILLHVVLL